MENVITGKEPFDIYRQKAEEQEESMLHPLAAQSSAHSRYFGREDDHRLPYKRDVDRIVHSKAYARYVDKTQVVYLIEYDHIAHRSLHVQLVSNFARGIAQILGLNLDLVEAISLGHDVGHPPFGHEGEGYLSELSLEYCKTPFTHPWQSCHLFSNIEPLNLGLSVYDGFLCHDGGMCGTVLKPNFGKTWEIHFQEREQKRAHPEMNIWPGTLEGCLVKICDTVSYLGKDIEDAIALQLITREQIPKTFLGTSNREILSSLARDIIKMSIHQNYIALSEEAYECLLVLRKFNFENIYFHPLLKAESNKIQRSYRILFELLLEDAEKQGENSFLWKKFLHNKSQAYLQANSRTQHVIDLIAGMTDSYFLRALEKLILPKKTEIF